MPDLSHRRNFHYECGVKQEQERTATPWNLQMQPAFWARQDNLVHRPPVGSAVMPTVLIFAAGQLPGIDTRRAKQTVDGHATPLLLAQFSFFLFAFPICQVGRNI